MAKTGVFFPSIQTYVASNDVDFVETVKPLPQPTSDIGKTDQLRGTKTKPVLLYSTASAKKAFGNGKWQSNEWRSKDLKIVESLPTVTKLSRIDIIPIKFG